MSTPCKLVYLLVMLCMLMGQISSWQFDPIRPSCCSLSKSEAERDIFKTPGYTEDQTLQFYWNWMINNVDSEKMFIRALSYLPDSIRNEIVERIKVLVAFRNNFEDKFPYHTPKAEMISFCSDAVKAGENIFWSSSDDLQLTPKPPGRRLVENAKDRDGGDYFRV